MSFIITLYVREGIVMAADSRLSLNASQQHGGQQMVQLGIFQSDAYQNLFLGPHNIGIAVSGAMDANGSPIAEYLEVFFRDDLAAADCRLDDVPYRLRDYMRQFPNLADTTFHIAGYAETSQASSITRSAEAEMDGMPELLRDLFQTSSRTSEGHPAPAHGTPKEQQVWNLTVRTGEIKQLNPPGQQGVSWSGEVDILARLLQPVGVLDPQGSFNAMPHFDIPWQFFSLQDAIDFAGFAMRATSELQRFQARPKTVGGPLDLLVITPDGAQWLQRKALRPRAE